MMLYVRRPKLLAVGLPVLAALCAASHIEYHYREQRLTGQRKPEQVVVRVENGPLGHNTLGIDEGAASASRLQFATLAQWVFDPKAPSPCPASVQALNGKEASCIGFMYPLQAGEKVKAFCLLRSTQTCCYGPRPQYNQYLLVEMPEAVKFERLAPVTVTGKFFVEPRPADGYIYRMEGATVQPAADDTPEVDSGQAAQQAGLPLFDFALMPELEKRKQPTPELLALDGKQVVVEGVVLERTPDNPPQLIVGSAARFAVVPRPTPTVYSALMIVPRDAAQVPPAWKQKTTFTGTLYVNCNEQDRAATGVVSLRNAVLGVPGVSTSGVIFDSGPFLPVYVEVFLLAALLTLSLWRKVPQP